MAGPLPSGPTKGRISTLSNEIFVAADFTATTLSPALKARSAAFILLAHAEIENAVELECRKLAQQLESSPDPALALIAWGFANLRTDGTSSKASRLPLVDLVKAYSRVVDGNHGVRKSHLDSLLIPLGVDTSSLKTDIEDLDSFGRRRGELAHKSLTTWTTTDLPSAHVTAGLQAGQSADNVIAAVQSSHARVAPTIGRGPRVPIRQLAASLLRSFAHLIDS